MSHTELNSNKHMRNEGVKKTPNTLSQHIARSHKITSAVFVVPDAELPFLVLPRSIHSHIPSPEVATRYVAVSSNCTQEDRAREEQDRSSPSVGWTSVSWWKPRTAQRGENSCNMLGPLRSLRAASDELTCPDMTKASRPCLCMWMQPNWGWSKFRWSSTPFKTLWSCVWATLAPRDGSHPSVNVFSSNAAPRTRQDISNSDRSWLTSFQT